jgi:hypothetical protein
MQMSLSLLAQVIKSLTCIWDVTPLNLGWHIAVPTNYLWSSSVPPVKCWDSTLGYTMPASFYILSGSVFTIIKSFDTILWRIYAMQEL